MGIIIGIVGIIANSNSNRKYTGHSNISSNSDNRPSQSNSKRTSNSENIVIPIV